MLFAGVQTLYLDKVSFAIQKGSSLYQDKAITVLKEIFHISE